MNDSLYELIRECDFRIEGSTLVIDCPTVRASKQVFAEIEAFLVYSRKFPVSHFRIDLIRRDLYPPLPIAPTRPGNSSFNVDIK